MSQSDCAYCLRDSDICKKGHELECKLIYVSRNKFDLNNWRDKCNNTAKEKGWGWLDGQSSDPTFLSAQLMLCVTELAEACEDLRKGYIKTMYLEKTNSGAEVVHTEQMYVNGIPQYKPIGFPSEVADVLIRLFHISGEANIDLVKEVKDKDLYNNTRSFRHGNKKL
jgi:hypothetical protein